VRNISLIAGNVIKDAVRRKLFYVVFLFALAMVALSPLLPSFEMGARASFLRDISLSLTSLFGVVMAVVLSVGQIPGEIEKRTIYNILSKPVSRLQYLLGKYLGILAVLAAILTVIGLEIIVLIYARLGVLTPVIYQGVLGVFLESAVTAAFCLGLSAFATVPVNIFATILFYLLCHVKTGFLREELVGGASGFLRSLAWGLYYIIPNLENYNLSQRVGYGGGLPGIDLLRITAYAALFAAVFLTIGYLVLRRKDL
jgi:ABC-type transport system involved in multi-copper enzyme maturation permease subunit